MKNGALPRVNRVATESYIYDGIYHPHLGRSSRLDNQEGAKTERYVFGKLSATCFQRRHFLRRHYLNGERHRAWKVGPGGCGVWSGIHRRSAQLTKPPKMQLEWLMAPAELGEAGDSIKKKEDEEPRRPMEYRRTPRYS